jgi:signal peptidase I
MSSALKRFLFPQLTRRFLLRATLVGLGSYAFFGFMLTPGWIRGASMEPTYHDGRLVFCFRLRYRWTPPRPGDIVMVRFSGHSVMLLKRVVAVEGQTVEIRDGILHIDGEARPEPYVKYRNGWDLPPRTVRRGHIYVIGDNRGMSQAEHVFGQTPLSRVEGAPLW